MQPSTKKLLGLMVFLPAFLIYIGVVVTIADFLPQHWAVLGLYFVIAAQSGPFRSNHS